MALVETSAARHSLEGGESVEVFAVYDDATLRIDHVGVRNPVSFPLNIRCEIVLRGGSTLTTMVVVEPGVTIYNVTGNRQVEWVDGPDGLFLRLPVGLRVEVSRG